MDRQYKIRQKVKRKKVSKLKSKPHSQQLGFNPRSTERQLLTQKRQFQRNSTFEGLQLSTKVETMQSKFLFSKCLKIKEEKSKSHSTKLRDKQNGLKKGFSLKLRKNSKQLDFPANQLYTNQIDLLSTDIMSTKNSARTQRNYYAAADDCEVQQLCNLQQIKCISAREDIVHSARSKTMNQSALKIQKKWRQYRQKKCLTSYLNLIKQKLSFQKNRQQIFAGKFKPVNFSFSDENSSQQQIKLKYRQVEPAVMESIKNSRKEEVRRWSDINKKIKQSLEGQLDQSKLLQQLLIHSKQLDFANDRIQAQPQLPNYQQQSQMITKLIELNSKPTFHFHRNLTNPSPIEDQELSNQDSIICKLQLLKLQRKEQPTSQDGSRCPRPQKQSIFEKVFEQLILQAVREDQKLIDIYLLAEYQHIDTSNQGAFTYVKMFLQFILQKESTAQSIQFKLNRVPGLTSKGLLKLIQQGQIDELDQQSIISPSLFAQFQNNFIGESDAQYTQFRLSFDRALFQALNQALQSQRIYGIYGEPKPWISHSTRSIEKRFKNRKINDLFQDSLRMVQKWLIYRMGLLPEREPGMSDRQVNRFRRQQQDVCMRDETLLQEGLWLNQQDQITQVGLNLQKQILLILSLQTAEEAIKLKSRFQS